LKSLLYKPSFKKENRQRATLRLAAAFAHIILLRS
jgi:hypothetical protein